MRVAIETEIFSGALNPGDPIDEKAICARFKTSRTPVREAMLQLAIQGFIEIRPRAGIFVATATHKELVSMLEMIAELEGAVAGMAARRISRDDLVALLEIQDRGALLASAENVDGYTEANASFHELLYKAGANALLADAIRNLRRRLQLYRRNVMTAPGRLRRSSQEHAQVVQAIRVGDADAAQRAMVSHISQGNQAFIDLVMSIP